MKLFYFIINTNIFISLAAVALTLETQVELGFKPQLHPYLFIIFFATIFEYNLHRLITVVKNPEALKDDKHKWVKEYPFAFYSLVLLSVVGFAISVIFAVREVIITLFPIGLLTLLYSLPLLRIKKIVFRLREIPLLKIFIIALVWSCATILLPVIQSGVNLEPLRLLTLLVERFIFVFAITIPFDIRDMDADKGSGLKTLPLLIGEKHAQTVSLVSLMIFAVVSTVHCLANQMNFLLPAMLISVLSTFIFLTNKKIQKTKYYHYFVLDGTMLLQGLLVCLFYYFH